MVAGYVSILTGYRRGQDGFAIERNTRYADHVDGNEEMLHHLLGGRTLNGWSLRKILEEESTYDGALARVKTVPFVSTEYNILSGVRKGHIVSRNPDAVAFLQTLGAPNFDEPPEYILITNFDFFWGDVREWFDPTGGKMFRPRRIEAQKLLNGTLQKGSALTPAVLNATINAEGVLADTIWQVIINVEKDIWLDGRPALP